MTPLSRVFAAPSSLQLLRRSLLPAAAVAENHARSSRWFSRLGVGVSATAVALTAAVAIAEEDAIGPRALPPRNLNELNITLYQYQPCPFCTKVRTFLDFAHLAYDKVEVDPLRKPEIAFSKNYRKVPIVIIDGIQYNDSTNIISAFAERLGITETDEERQWRSWVDDHLVHLLPANIYRTMGEALQSFDYLMESSFNFSSSQRFMARYSGAIIMYLLSRFKLNKKYGIENPRQDLYNAVDKWVDGLGERRFMSGTYKPGLADLAVFGALRSLEGLDCWQDMMSNTKVRTWYDRMNAAIGPTCGSYVSLDQAMARNPLLDTEQS